MTGARARWMRRLALTAGALAACCVVAELWFRFVPAVSPERWALDQIRLQTSEGSPIMKEIKAQEAVAFLQVLPDAELGALLAPNQHVLNKTPDYTYTLETDQFGFTNRGAWPETIDAAVLGNSLIVGAGVGLDGQFTTLLNRRFPGRSFINLGTPGGGTETELRIYTRFAEPRQPKLVIATVWIVWEVDNTIKFAHWLAERPDQEFTAYRFGYGAAHPEKGAAKAKERRGLGAVLWKSALVRAGYLSAKALTTRSPYTQQVSFPNGDVLDLSLREQLRLAKGMARPDAPDVEDLLLGPLEKLRDRVAQRGGKFIVVLVPSREEIYGAASFPRVLKTIDEVKPLLAARNLPVLDLYPLFRERGKDRSTFFEREMHLNAYGNQVLADGIGEWIDQTGVFNARDSSDSTGTPAEVTVAWR